MSVFDPQTFAQMTFTEANATESHPIPVGEHDFTIEKSEITAWQKRDDPSQGGLKCTLTLKTDDPAVAEATGRPLNRVRHEIMLDITPEGGLDMGKGMNVMLGRAREACSLNKPGQAFAFDMFIGHNVRGKIKHQEYEGKLQAKCTEIG